MEKWDRARGTTKTLLWGYSLKSTGLVNRTREFIKLLVPGPDSSYQPQTSLLFSPGSRLFFLLFFFIVMYYTYIYLEVGNSKTKVPSNYCSGKGTFLAPLTISVCMCTLVHLCLRKLFVY